MMGGMGEGEVWVIMMDGMVVGMLDGMVAGMVVVTVACTLDGIEDWMFEVMLE